MSFVTRYCGRCGKPGRHFFGCPKEPTSPQLADFHFDLKDVVARKAIRISLLEKENGDLRALVCRLRRFIHNEAAIAIADTDEFEAIDREIAAMGIRLDLGKETE